MPHNVTTRLLSSRELTERHEPPGALRESNLPETNLARSPTILGKTLAVVRLAGAWVTRELQYEIDGLRNETHYRAGTSGFYEATLPFGARAALASRQTHGPQGTTIIHPEALYQRTGEGFGFIRDTTNNVETNRSGCKLPRYLMDNVDEVVRTMAIIIMTCGVEYEIRRSDGYDDKKVRRIDGQKVRSVFLRFGINPKTYSRPREPGHEPTVSTLNSGHQCLDDLSNLFGRAFEVRSAERGETVQGAAGETPLMSFHRNFGAMPVSETTVAPNRRGSKVLAVRERQPSDASATSHSLNVELYRLKHRNTAEQPPPATTDLVRASNTYD